MAKKLSFVKLETSIKGLMARALIEWDRYLEVDQSAYQWVCIEEPHYLAKSLEVLAVDIPEDDIASLVTRMPYLMVLMKCADDGPSAVPIEALFAFLSVLNHAGLVTLLRQTSDRHRLCALYDLATEEWEPLLFMLGGKPDVDLPLAQAPMPQCLFF